MKPTDFIDDMYRPDDLVALVLVSRDEESKTQQRIWNAKKAASKGVLKWLKYSNTHGYDIYIGMNPLQPGSRTRNKEDVQEVRRVYLDLDEDGPSKLKEVLQDGFSGKLPSASYIINTSPDRYQLIWNVEPGSFTPQRSRGADARPRHPLRRRPRRDRRFARPAAARLQASRQEHLDHDERHVGEAQQQTGLASSPFRGAGPNGKRQVQKLFPTPLWRRYFPFRPRLGLDQGPASRRRCPRRAGDPTRGCAPRQARSRRLRQAHGRPGAGITFTGAMKLRLSPYALGFVLLAEGWASLGTEILALRRLTPWAGSTVDVTSVLLAVYLAALAGGYRRGGRLARLGDPRPRLARRLAAAALWSAFWLSEPGVLLAFSLPAAPLLQAFAYAVVGIAPVGWLLAECVLLAHACAPPRDASERAGGVFALSTVGNVTGALAATFLLLPMLGLAAAVFSVMAASAVAALVVSHRSISVHALLFAACWPSLDLWVEATQYVSRNAYADYRIVSIDDDARVLVINNQSASRHDPQGRGWEYAELLERTLCGAGEQRVLVLGAAGMTLGQGAPCDLAAHLR